uniref:Aminotransferase-like plant mobile domain-containing protein n=1 Tax=Aegilops tauschii subsp. strangulata TaxID=200361 RepID=A0A452Z048_AEGTS
SLFVLPAPPFDVVRAEVLPVAARLARGGCVALGPAALASIYSDLSALNRYINLDKRYQPFVGWAPLHILQLWVLARFPELRPEMATTLDPVARHQPWAARWHQVHKVIDPINLHRVFMLPMEFEWRPYGSFTFAPSPKKSCSWVHGRDMARSLQLLSFAQCLRACELVGMRCIEQYNPHRVARQLGFDQDVPGSVARVNSDWKIAWGTYFMEPSNFAFIVPQYTLAVTFEYTRWWRPYTSGCDTAIDNNVNPKEFPVLVGPRDKNMEVLHDDNSGKKQHVLPGMSRPDTFEVFFSRLNTFEVSQTDIPLVEKLNGLDTIQGTLEHLVEVARSAQIADNSTLRCVRKGTQTKNVKQASPAVFAKQNSSSEHGEVAPRHLVKRAVSTTNRKAIGATVGHVQPSLEDIVVMLDEEFDESVGKEHEVGATVGRAQPSLEDLIVISDEEFDESVGKEHGVGAMPREGNEKANEDASASNQQSDTLMEDCTVVNRKSSEEIIRCILAIQ